MEKEDKLKQKLIDEIKKLMSDIVSTQGAVLEADFYRWKVRAENLVIRICGKDNTYLQALREAEKVEAPGQPAYWSPDFVWGLRRIHYKEAAYGVLQGLLSDLEAGLLMNIKELAIAEVFADFLEMAEHLLENDYKDPAALLIGAVLEDGLRRIATKHSIPVKNSDNISALNQKLYQKNIYDKLIFEQIKAWSTIRNYAAHGHFEKYQEEDVRDMLKGVRDFLIKQLGASI